MEAACFNTSSELLKSTLNEEKNKYHSVLLWGNIGLIRFPVAFVSMTLRGRIIARGAEELMVAPWVF